MERFKHELDLLPMVLGTQSKLRANGKGPLVIRITLNCLSEELSLSTTVNPQNWLVDKKEVSKEEDNYKLINKNIKAVEVDLRRIYDKLYLEDYNVSPLMIKRVYFGKSPIPIIDEKPKQEESMLSIFEFYIDKFNTLVQKGKRSDGTLRQWKSTKKKVSEFLAWKYSKDDIKFPDISVDFGDEMFDYLTIEVSHPLAEPTAKKHIKKTKQILKLAVKKKLIPINPIADFVCGGDTNEVIPLEWEEVERIYDKEFCIQRLDEVADAFIFQCFTGFAYQDLFNLTPKNIVLFGPTKEKWLCKHRGKTGVYEIVPILPVIEQLIEKYKDHPICKQRGSLLPILSNTNFNGYLKEIGTICGIERDLNTHLARHTFADIMLNLGMPLEDVSKMLGHKSIRTTQRYARVKKLRIHENFKKFVRPFVHFASKQTQELPSSLPLMQNETVALEDMYDYNSNHNSTSNSTIKYTYNYTAIA